MYSVAKKKYQTPKNLIPTVKPTVGGDYVLVWGCMSATRVGKLHIIDGIIDHKIYIKVLKKNLYVSTQKLEISDKYLTLSIFYLCCNSILKNEKKLPTCVLLKRQHFDIIDDI